MGRALLAAALIGVLTTSAPALHRITDVQIAESVLAPGETIVVRFDASNPAEKTRRERISIRVRGHRHASRRTRRIRVRPARAVVKLFPGEERSLELRIPLPDDALGALRVEVRSDRRRRPVTTRYVYVLDGPVVPDNAGPNSVPFQPVLSASAIRGDADVSQRHEIVRDEAAWSTLLDVLDVRTPAVWGRDDDAARNAPGYARPFAIDFANETVLGIFTGTVTVHEDRVRIAAIKRGAERVVVLYDVIRHRPRGVAYTADHVWAPYVVVSIPRTDLPIVVRRRR